MVQSLLSLPSDQAFQVDRVVQEYQDVPALHGLPYVQLNLFLLLLAIQAVQVVQDYLKAPADPAVPAYQGNQALHQFHCSQEYPPLLSNQEDHPLREGQDSRDYRVDLCLHEFLLVQYLQNLLRLLAIRQDQKNLQVHLDQELQDDLALL